MTEDKRLLFIERLEKLLVENIVEFWHSRTVDEVHGGFHLNHDQSGRDNGPANKSAVAQARMVYFFTVLAHSSRGRAGYQVAARQGFRFLVDKLWDSEFGGVFWEVSASGDRATLTDKHVYAQAFALYALATYGRCTGDAEAATLAAALFGLLERYAHDPEYGGWHECFGRDWSPMPSQASAYIQVQTANKTFNTHIHILEAFIAYHQLSPEERVRKRLHELILILSRAVVRKPGACTNLFHRDWSACQGRLAERVSYGHDIENVWLLIHALGAAQMPVAPLDAFFRENFEITVRHGFDHRKGGLFDHGPLGRKAKARHKVWWAQAEMLVGTLELYFHFEDETYLWYFEKTLDWITNKQADWQNGDWHQRLTRRGKVLGAKAEPWKTAYHNGRAVLHCLERIENPYKRGHVSTGIV